MAEARFTTGARDDPSLALTRALTEHRTELLRFLVARLRDPADAEDALHDLCLRVASGTGEAVANPLAYLYRAAANLALDRARGRSRRLVRDGAWATLAGARAGEETIDPTPSADERLDQRRTLLRIARAIEALPPGAGRIFRRHRLDGRSHAEIAAEFGISRSAVEKGMATALRHLMRALGTEDGGAGGV